VALSQLQINHVRNLHDVRLQGLQRVNVFFGRNGSGKTSVLESIHLLGMARSFRGNSIKSLITHEMQSCTVYGKTTLPHSALVGIASPNAGGLPLGVQRNRVGEAHIKIGGKVVRSVAELAELLPLQVITADSFSLLTGSPAARRQFLDWGVFHVEQQFFGQWQRFQRSIKQRNNLLRRGKVVDSELTVWSRDLALTGTAINEYRKDYFRTLSPLFKEIMARLAPSLDALELRYQQGWDRQLSYAEALQHGLSADLEQGYTHSGPQRADIRVLCGGQLATDILSRGQQKLVVCGLKLAQGQLMARQGRGTCTYLIDDLPSELDYSNSLLVCELLASMEAQVFITCIEQQDIRSVWPGTDDLAMFHVEQGVVRQVSGG
jgi:DNA replication and repair protein RecF